MRHDDILRLNVTMSDTILVQVLDGRCDFFNFYYSFFLRQYGVFLEVQEQSSFFHVLEHDVNMVFIIKASI